MSALVLEGRRKVRLACGCTLSPTGVKIPRMTTRSRPGPLVDVLPRLLHGTKVPVAGIPTTSSSTRRYPRLTQGRQNARSMLISVERMYVDRYSTRIVFHIFDHVKICNSTCISRISYPSQLLASVLSIICMYSCPSSL